MPKLKNKKRKKAWKMNEIVKVKATHTEPEIVPVQDIAPAPTPDPREARINALNDELQDRRRFIEWVNKHKGFEAFCNATIHLDGQIKGLQESLQLAPLTSQEGLPKS